MERVIAGSCALVTGGARGIGRATARALLDEGLKVVIADLDLAEAERAASALGGPGRVVVARVLDVRDREAFARLVAAVEEEVAPVDVLVNNAGILALGSFLQQSPESDARQLEVNLHGVMNGLRAALPGMVRRRRGHVVNVASAAGRIAVPHAAVYCATKHAVVGLSESVRQELEDSGVDLSCVLPAFVRTELIAGARSPRFPPPVSPEQVAEAVVELLRTGREEAYVPRFARLAVLGPALLPRRWAARVGRWLGLDRAFADPDPSARATYAERLRALDPLSPTSTRR